MTLLLIWALWLLSTVTIHPQYYVWSEEYLSQVPTTNQEINQTSAEPILRVKGFDIDSNATKIINYAYKISNWDMDFILTLKAENWAFDMYKQSNVVKNWIKEDSRGLCQLHRKRHKEVDTKEFWESRQYQIELCYKKYSWWTKFYWYYVREKYRDQFYWE